MLKLAITLLHDKTNTVNENRISTILGMLTKHEQTTTEMVSDRIFKEVQKVRKDSATGVETPYTELEETATPEYEASFTTYYYTINAIDIPHEVRFYHVVPFGINRPSNMDELDGHKVIYGPEFQMVEKTFFDWGLKRGTDHGADVSIYVEDLSKLDFKKLLPKLEKVKDKQDPTEFLQEAGAKIANVEYMKKGGLK